MTELWRPVVGWEQQYLVSDQGRVQNRRTGRILRQCLLDGRYRALGLRKNGIAKMRKVHHLVAEAFIGPRPEGLWCLHRDDDKENNSAANLYWGTGKDNQADCIRNGHRQDQLGEANNYAKLTEADVLEIRRQIASGRMQSEIADEFGVSRMLITRIKQRQLWAHVA